jgi:cobalamin-dependent methionine synthase I
MEVALDIEEVKRYLKYEGHFDDVTQNNVDKALKLLKKHVKPKYVIKYFPIKTENNIIELENSTIIWNSKNLAEHLKDCHGVVLVLASLGLEIDKEIKKLEIIDIGLAYILNALAVEYLEKYLDYIQNNNINVNGNLTSRYSIGYGDLNIEYQDEMIKVLDGTKLIGVSVLETHIMVPSKSVSAIIGVSKKDVSSDLKKCSNCLSNGKCSGACIDDKEKEVD